MWLSDSVVMLTGGRSREPGNQHQHEIMLVGMEVLWLQVAFKGHKWLFLKLKVAEIFVSVLEYNCVNSGLTNKLKGFHGYFGESRHHYSHF